VASQSAERRDQDAVEIGTLYQKGREAILESVQYNLQAGRKLIEKKGSMPHGEWVTWLRANVDVLGFKHRTTASRLMKAAAANDASTHPLNEAEAIRLNRKLWGNPAAASVKRSSTESSPRKRSHRKSGQRPKSPTAVSRPYVPLSKMPSLAC
jgi:hypothetical protein